MIPEFQTSWLNCMYMEFDMQFCQYGCLSTRLDFRNDVLRDEHSGLNKLTLFCQKKIGYNFPLYILSFPLYLQKRLALSKIAILCPETFFWAFWYLSPWHTKIWARNSKKVFLWHNLLCISALVLECPNCFCFC